MEYIIGILILASFFGLAVYAARGGNLMMGMLIMAILWTILPMTGNLLASNPDLSRQWGQHPDHMDTGIFQGVPERS